MVDQDEIDDLVLAWTNTHKDLYLGDAQAAFHQQWEQFVEQHDAETAQALRENALFEFFRLVTALFHAVAHEVKSGISVDESIVDSIREGGTPSFTGDRARVRQCIDELVANRELIIETLMERRADK